MNVKMKLKTLVVAVAMAATGAAQAANVGCPSATCVIDSDKFVSGSEPAFGTGTGVGELFFSILDPGQAKSLVLDLNLTANTFRSNNASLINTFSVTDSLLQSFIAASPDQTKMRWNLGGLSNMGKGPNAGLLTTHGSAGATINPATEGPFDNTSLFTGLGATERYERFNSTLFTSTNPNSAISVASSPSGHLGGAWSSAAGGIWTFSNEQTGLTGTQLMSFIYFGATEAIDFDALPLATAFSDGKWKVDATTGTVSYVGQVSAVPVPAAVWLFGSGLLGLVGIGRRRKQA